MTEGLLARARRVVEAGVGSVVETAERLTGAGLMRQAVRDAEHAVDDVRRQQSRSRRRAAQAGEQARLADERAAKMEGEARYALNLGRDDLATAAVTQKQAAEADAAAARAAQADAAVEADKLDATIADLAGRHQALAEELRAHELAARASAPSVPLALDRKITHAEQSFARARAAVGVSASALGVEELDRLRRDRMVAEELARLKAGPDAPLPPRRGRKG